MAAWLIWSLLSACLLVSASPEQENITAESGQSVTLPCRASINNIKTFEWSRTDLGKEYVFLIRDEVLTATNQHPLFKNRVELQDRQMKDGDVSVILKNVTVNDKGIYECRVTLRNSRRRRSNLKNDPICIINLSVAPPGQTQGPTEDGGFFGLIVGLSVAAVLLAVAAVAFVCYRKHKDKKSRASCSPPDDQQLH
ncbi:hepatitis A virus cellular receptor 2-like [Archocentrus centrarchus]|uniref:hepatitis A virus cellular receptor 2-like n=1 Tax=Archocentrus centrarchus TaxID=63155 RepID=UPI0011EA14D9|nr:hepatitis A virus cellular receptor 2-like [Archocentrus centrarchus]